MNFDDKIREAYMEIGRLNAYLRIEQDKSAYWEKVAHEELVRRVNAESKLQDIREQL